MKPLDPEKLERVVAVLSQDFSVLCEEVFRGRVVERSVGTCRSPCMEFRMGADPLTGELWTGGLIYITERS